MQLEDRQQREADSVAHATTTANTWEKLSHGIGVVTDKTRPFFLIAWDERRGGSYNRSGMGHRKRERKVGRERERRGKAD